MCGSTDFEQIRLEKKRKKERKGKKRKKRKKKGIMDISSFWNTRRSCFAKQSKRLLRLFK
jgi:hypothetical protein